MDGDEDQRVVELLRYDRHAARPLKPADRTFSSRYYTCQAESSTSRAKEDPIDQKLQTLSLSSHDDDATNEARTSRTSDPDSTLLALCQFAATKLDAQVVGISLLGRHEQYVLADSTQILGIDESTTEEAFDDERCKGIAQVQTTINLSGLPCRMS
jgi:hypothetical protein